MDFQSASVSAENVQSKRLVIMEAAPGRSALIDVIVASSRGHGAASRCASRGEAMWQKSWKQGSRRDCRRVRGEGRCGLSPCGRARWSRATVLTSGAGEAGAAARNAHVPITQHWRGRLRSLTANPQSFALSRLVMALPYSPKASKTLSQNGLIMRSSARMADSTSSRINSLIVPGRVAKEEAELGGS